MNGACLIRFGHVRYESIHISYDSSHVSYELTVIAHRNTGGSGGSCQWIHHLLYKSSHVSYELVMSDMSGAWLMWIESWHTGIPAAGVHALDVLVIYPLSHVSYESSHVWYEWVISNMNLMAHTNTGGSGALSMHWFHMNKSCLIWMSHVSYELSHVSYEWSHIWYAMSHVTQEHLVPALNLLVTYGEATISRLLKIIGLFWIISSLWQGSFD